MKLWTIKDEEVYKKILKDFSEKGYHECDTLTYPEFSDAFDWMREQMKQRLPAPESENIYPTWAHHTDYYKRKAPRIKDAYFAEKGTKCVLIELEIPDELVLLSDSDGWDMVLLNATITGGVTNDELDFYDDLLKTLPENIQEQIKVKSWEKIFLTEKINIKKYAYFNGRYIQATFWRLKKEYVKSVKYYTFKKDRSM